MRAKELRNKRASTARAYNIKEVGRKPGESDLAYYKRLAKQSDQRLVRLEQYSRQGNPNVLQYAYRVAMYDIESIYGSGSRFNRKLVMNKDGSVNQNQLRMRIAAMEKFLTMPTSTPKGIKSVYKNRIDTINQRYGTEFDWEDLANLYQTGIAEALDMQYGSKTKLRSLGFIKRHQFSGIREINAYVKKAREENINLPSEEVLEQARDLFRTSRGRRAINRFNN